MQSIRVLIADDVSDNIVYYKEKLEMELAKFDLLPVVIDGSTSRYKAYQHITNESNNPIDVAMVDLCLTRESGEPDGASVLDDMKTHYPDAYVVLYTQNQELHWDFKERFGRAANVSLAKNEIRDGSTWSFKRIAQEVDRHLISIGRKEATGKTYYKKSDVGIMSVLEDVGRGVEGVPSDVAGSRILRYLAFECLDGEVGQDRELTIEFLAAGRSGANVCKLDFHETQQHPRQSFVLKFGFDEGALINERSRNAEAVRVLGQAPLMSIIGKLGSHKRGYRAIVANFAASSSDDVMPLRRWLTGPATAEQAKMAAQELLCGQLKRLFTSVQPERAAVDDWIALQPGRQLRALAVIERYRHALEDDRVCDVTDSSDLVRRLTQFVGGDRSVAGAPSPRREVSRVKAFGDLHSNNVLIQLDVNPRPTLVDASLYGSDHWSADNARLLVDLLLRVRNSGVESMLWPAIKTPDKQVVLLCPHCQLRESLETPEDGPVGAFIAQAVSQLSVSTHRERLAVPLDAWHWEWHVGLARELLRQSSYEDLSPPRVCMALLLADQHLGIARDLPQ